MTFDHLRLERLAGEIVAGFSGEAVLEVTRPFEFGEVNFTALVTTEQRKFVVRLNPEDGIETFQREAWAIQLASAQGVRTPAALHVGEYEGVAASIFPYIDSINGKQYADKAKIWWNIGRFASRMHSIPVSGYGEELVDAAAHQFGDTFQRYLQYNIDSLTPDDELIREYLLTSVQSWQLREALSRLAKADLKFGLSHGDLSEKNTLVDAGGSVWLIDWGCLGAQVVPHFDFDAVLGWNCTANTPEFANFLAGYGMSAAEFSAILPEIEAFGLLQAVDKVRWALARQPDAIPEKVNDLHKRLSNPSLS
jgi:aminoglycoside phosphotransferase (APT) family kinase protein